MAELNSEGTIMICEIEFPHARKGEMTPWATCDLPRSGGVVMGVESPQSIVVEFAKGAPAMEERIAFAGPGIPYTDEMLRYPLLIPDDERLAVRVQSDANGHVSLKIHAIVPESEHG